MKENGFVGLGRRTMKQSLVILLVFLSGNVRNGLAWLNVHKPCRAIIPHSSLLRLHQKSHHRDRLDTRLFEKCRHQHQDQQRGKNIVSNASRNRKARHASPTVPSLWNPLVTSLKVFLFVATMLFGLVANAGEEDVLTTSLSASLESQPPTEITVSTSSSPTTTTRPIGKRYWSIMETGDPKEKVAANEALVVYAVGTINTMLYDNRYVAVQSKWRSCCGSRTK